MTETEPEAPADGGASGVEFSAVNDRSCEWPDTLNTFHNFEVLCYFYPTRTSEFDAQPYKVNL